MIPGAVSAVATITGEAWGEIDENAAGNTFIYFSLLTIMLILSILLFLLLFLLATTHRHIVKCDWDYVPCSRSS